MSRRHFIKHGITQAGLLAWLGSKDSFAASAGNDGATSVAPVDMKSPARDIFQTGDVSDEASVFLASWRGPQAHSEHYAGLIRADWRRGVCSIEQEVLLPGRPHGLNVLRDGSLLAVGIRPGQWLLRWHESGQTRYEPDQDMTLNGHAASSEDQSLLYSTESQREGQRGYVVVRDAKRFEVIHRWPTGGIEPHQLLIDHRQRLWIAHGGIRRGAGDRKIALDTMASKLSCLDARDGSILGHWTVPDRWLSMRHLAWANPQERSGSGSSSVSASGEDSDRLLGIAMQAEHPSTTTREQAPVLAVFSDDRIHIIGGASRARGYGGDISAAPGGGFCVSSNRGRSLLWWHPGLSGDMKAIASIEEPYALCHAKHDSTVYLACAWGLARWNTTQAQMLPWPKPMMLDNHWVLT